MSRHGICDVVYYSGQPTAVRAADTTDRQLHRATGACCEGAHVTGVEWGPSNTKFYKTDEVEKPASTRHILQKCLTTFILAEVDNCSIIDDQLKTEVS